MRKTLLLILLVSISATAFSQMDLLVLQKNRRTIQTWTRGSYITFQFSSKQWINGYIKDIRHDSLLVDMFTVQAVYTSFGVFRQDTGRMGLLKLHVKEIYAMPKKDNAGIISNGSLLQIGSAAIILLNIANSLIRNEQVFSARNVTTLGIAGGVFALGTLLASTHKTSLVLGKKYRMQVLSTATE